MCRAHTLQLPEQKAEKAGILNSSSLPALAEACWGGAPGPQLAGLPRPGEDPPAGRCAPYSPVGGGWNMHAKGAW